ncbi:MAG: hypothetical protein ACLQPD_09785, partial [Desulfomonilaceae bacterium]
ARSSNKEASNSKRFLILSSSFMPPLYSKREIKLQALFCDEPLDKLTMLKTRVALIPAVTHLVGSHMDHFTERFRCADCRDPDSFRSATTTWRERISSDEPI